ncbi:MAG: hypothetical protein VKK04_16465 [Synechococcales bacterium]|nr:hypothetical protein [Synechococcales bacterium]
MLLSPTASYYLRRILRKNCDRLQFVAAPNAAIKAHALADLDRVVQSLYLDEEEVAARVHQLENLIQVHQMLAEQGSMYLQHQLEIEGRILWILGFKLVEPSSPGF